MTVRELQAKIAATTSVEELEALRTNEQRVTVLNAIDQRLRELSPEGADDEEGAGAESPEPSGDDEGEEAVGTDTESPEPAIDDAAAEEDAATEQEPDIELGFEEPEELAPVVAGRGKNTEPVHAGYQVKAPKATGKLGFEGNLYDRTYVANNPALMKRMYDAGCKAIIKN